MNYFANPEKCAFPPQPGDIIGCIPELEAKPYCLPIEELKELEKRKEQGEEFFGLADVLKAANLPDLAAGGKKIPE